MITITSQPETGSILAAYLPIFYRVVVRDETANVAPIVEASVSVNGTLYTSFRVPYIESQVAGSDTDYSFDIDLAEVVQDAIRDVIPIPPINAYYFARVPLTEISVEFSAWYDNGSGLLIEDTVNTEPGTDVFVVNAYRKAQEGAEMQPYAENERLLLTRLPLSYELCKSNAFFLSVIDEIGGLGWEVKTYDASGSETSAGMLYPDSSAQQNIATLGAGWWQLQAVSLIPSFWQGFTVPVFSTSVVRYTVQPFLMPAERAIGPKFTFYVSDNCCGYQFLFLNSFGVWEVLNVWEEETINYAVDGETFASPRALPSDAVYLQVAQSQYLDKQGQNILNFILPESRDAWREFYKDFLASPEVYLIQGENLTPVLVGTGSFDIKRNHGLSIQVTWSNNETSQRR